MSSDPADSDVQLRQDIDAGRDAYAAAGNQAIFNITVAAEPSRAPEVPRRLWGPIPARNQGFTGREELLAAVRERLLADDKGVVLELYGRGGVGKTQLAAEYAHRFADSYDLVWWIAAEQAGLIGEQFAVLADDLGWALPGAETEAIQRVVLAELHGRDGWLLVFDNAETPAEVAEWLPGGSGHVLITSRERGGAEVAVPVEVGVLTRDESAAILQGRVARLSATDAGRLADQLGELPLAIAQAAGFMSETGMPAVEYLDLLKTRTAELLAQSTPQSYSRSLAATTQLIADRLAREDPAAAELARLCAFFSSEPIPQDIFTGAAAELPGELAAQAADPLAWRLIIGQLARQSVAQVDDRGLQMHRLTQAILREQMPAERAIVTRTRAEAILAAARPGDPSDPVTWPKWATLMPHLLASDLAATESPSLRQMACHTCEYLLARGETRPAYDLASRLWQEWRGRLGDDDQDTLVAAHHVGSALRDMGRYSEARDVHRQILERRRRVLGEDCRSTLTTANNLAADLRDLGELPAARDLAQDTLARRRRVLGEDHPHTLRSAGSLAVILRLLGEVQAARDLDQDTLERRRRVLGDDHPLTLASASNLDIDLQALDET